MVFWFRTTLAILALCFSSLTFAQVPENPIQAELVSEVKTFKPGESFYIGVRFIMDENWHIYWKNPGDAGMAPIIEWELPEGFTAEAVEWPYPQRLDHDSMVGYIYEGETILLTKVTVPPTFKPKEALLKGSAQWIVCSDSNCVPGDAALELKLIAGESSPSDHHALITDARAKVPQMKDGVSVSRKDNLLAIKVPSSIKNISNVYFCPENQDLISQNTAPLFDQTTYTLALADNEEQSDALKGTLVVETTDGTHAIALDLPLPPEKNELSLMALPLPRQEEAAIDPASHFEGGFFLALAFAFIGGMILNLMPCVLPVMSFKILSFVKMAGQSRRLTLQHGIAFSMGVIISFWVLAGALLALQAYGRSVGWGFQLQEPLFVAVLAAVIFLFGLNLFGVFEFGTSVTNWASDAQQKANLKQESLTSSFLSGVLATAVATPCTGPFLGSAVGFAVTLPTILSLIVFTTLGFGMAFPYLLLSGFPSLLRFMPKPGNWMITFKELMGFLMIATVLWLIWVFSSQTSSDSTFLLLTTFFFLTLGAWIYGKWGTPHKSLQSRLTGFVFALGCLGLAFYSMNLSVSSNAIATETTSHTNEGWEPFSQKRIEELQAKGIPVFVDFTARWCLICQTNHVVLTTGDVSAKMKEMGVVRMKADWTKNDPDITKALRMFGRNSVPLYLLYGTDPVKPPAVLPQVLTPEVVLEQLNQIDTSIEIGKS